MRLKPHVLDSFTPLRYNNFMSKIDKIKERVNYLKVWLGIFVVTNIGLVGWLTEHYNESKIKSFSAFFAIVLIASVVLVIHRKINNKIDELEEL